MADNYLITGYHGEPHVTAENDRGINAGTFGAGRFGLPVGERFRAEYIGNNTIRLYDGKLMDNGAAAGIPAGEFIDLLIANAGHSMNRNDLIVFQYSKDDSTAVESGSFVVIQGTETSGTAADPELTQEDLLTNNATFDQMALWRVPVSSATISAPEQLFEVSKTIGATETGVWTPTINAGTISNHNCTYAKVGNMVMLSFFITGTGGSGTNTYGDAASYMTITGVPFAPRTDANWFCGGGHVQGLNASTAEGAGGVFTGFALYRATNAIQARTSIGGYMLGNNGSKAFYLSGSIVYPTAE